MGPSLERNDKDLELQSSCLPRTPPPRNLQFSTRTKMQDESPGVRTVGSDITSTVGGTAVTIHHKVSSDANTRGGSPRVAGSVLGMNKWVIGGMALLLIAVSGGGLWSWLQIPGLNSQIEELEKQVDRLESEVDRLEDQNDRYEILNGQLNRTSEELRFTAERLEGTVDRLNNTVIDLEKLNQDLKEENERYAELNSQLNTILLFLNETSANINETYEQLVSYLAEQITVNRVLVLQTLENIYDQQTVSWDCTFRDIFQGEPFIADEDVPIGDGVPAVLEYVEEQILSEICISTSDFESFLEDRYSLELITVNQLFQGVAVYLIAVMNYYFPDEGEPGLTAEDWASADYLCENVASFSFTT